MQKMSANTTGSYSVPSCSSSLQQFSVCTQCPQLERQLEESNSEVRQLTAKLEGLQCTIGLRNQEVAPLENESCAIQFQVRLVWKWKLLVYMLYIYIMFISILKLELDAHSCCSIFAGREQYFIYSFSFSRATPLMMKPSPIYQYQPCLHILN